MEPFGPKISPGTTTWAVRAVSSASYQGASPSPPQICICSPSLSWPRGLSGRSRSFWGPDERVLPPCPAAAVTQAGWAIFSSAMSHDPTPCGSLTSRMGLGSVWRRPKPHFLVGSGSSDIWHGHADGSLRCSSSPDPSPELRSHHAPPSPRECPPQPLRSPLGPSGPGSRGPGSHRRSRASPGAAIPTAPPS